MQLATGTPAGAAASGRRCARAGQQGRCGRARAPAAAAAAAPRAAPHRTRALLRVAAAASTAVIDERKVFKGVPLPPVDIKNTTLVTIKPGAERRAAAGQEP